MISAFNLQPTKAELEKCANNYSTGMTEAQRIEEKNTFDAGIAIREGSRTPATLQKIVHWKSPRIVPLFDKNSTEEVKAALDVAVSHITVAEAMAALIKLQGVGVPVASAILAAIYPDRYTVIDFRALEALGYSDVNFYDVAYLDVLAAILPNKTWSLHRLIVLRQLSYELLIVRCGSGRKRKRELE